MNSRHREMPRFTRKRVLTRPYHGIFGDFNFVPRLLDSYAESPLVGQISGAPPPTSVF